MSLQNKIDFVAFVSVSMANSNGDPLNGNRPRTDYNGYGEISDVCIKRKIRNRMQDKKERIFVQSEDRCDDGYGALKIRAEKCEALKAAGKDRIAYAAAACREWTDVRTFGQVFAFSKDKDAGVSVGVRGPVSLHQAVSVNPVEIESLQITKSVNGESSEKRSSDTMGMKHMVRFGLYEIKGSINVQLASKTGFDEKDAALVKECLRTLFVNDASSARPDGSMEVCKLFWWQHNCPDGQYSSARVHASVHAVLNEGVVIPEKASDYHYVREDLPGLACEELDGL